MFQTLLPELDAQDGREHARTLWATVRAVAAMAQTTETAEYIAIGCRNLTPRAGLLHETTVARALRELRGSERLPEALREALTGWIDLVRKGEGDQPDAYRLTIPAYAVQLHDGRPLPTGNIAGVAPIWSQVEHTPAKGKATKIGLAGWTVYEAMQATGAAGTKDDIAELAGVSGSQAWRVLTALLDLGLVRAEPVGRAWVYRLTRRTLATAAAELGVDQVLDARHHRYRAQRSAWRTFLCLVSDRIQNRPEPPEYVDATPAPFWPNGWHDELPPFAPDPPVDVDQDHAQHLTAHAGL